jgi:hypothetical protein
LRSIIARATQIVLLSADIGGLKNAMHNPNQHAVQLTLTYAQATPTA